jgi:PAS domain S-box-containing protein
MLEAALQTAAGAIIVTDERGSCAGQSRDREVFGFARGAHRAERQHPDAGALRSRHDGYLRHHLRPANARSSASPASDGAAEERAIFRATAVSVRSRRPALFHGIVRPVGSRRRPAQQTCCKRLQSAADAVLIIDPASKITLCNPAVGRVFGYAPEELIARTAFSRDGAEQARVQKVKEGCAGERAGAPRYFRRKSGEIFPAETVISVLRDEKDHPIGFLSLNRDISHQVEQDEALRKSQRMEAVGQLTGGIAHDFNNLLTIITGNHELLEMELEDSEQRDLLARANNAALMGARLTNRLLTFARRRKLDPVILDLNEQVLTMAGCCAVRGGDDRA